MQQCPFESMGRSCGDLPGSDVAIFRDDRPYPDRVDESRLATLRGEDNDETEDET